MKKKALALLLPMAMVLSLLAGCSGEKETAEPAAPAATEKAAQATEKQADNSDVTLQIVVWSTPSDEYLDVLANAFTEETGIKIEYQKLATDNADYKQKVNIMVNGGTYYDGMFIVDGAQLPPLVEKGYVEPLTDYIARDINKDDYSGKVDVFTFDDGETYAMPIRGDYYMIFYNKDLFDQYNVPYPTDDMTWDDFEQLTYQLTGKDNVYGGLLFNWPAMVYNWAWQSGEYNVCSGVYDCLIPEYERTLRMQDAGSIVDYAVLSAGSGDAAFENGNIAMQINGTWNVGFCINYEKEGDLTFDWDVAHLPYHDEKDKGNIVGSVTPMTISSTSVHKEETWEFIKFVSGEKGAAILAKYGMLPALTTDSAVNAYVDTDGAPENLTNAMKCACFYMDKPPLPDIASYKQILDEEHSLIMLGEETIEEGIANINARAAEVGK